METNIIGNNASKSFVISTIIITRATVNLDTYHFTLKFIWRNFLEISFFFKKKIVNLEENSWKNQRKKRTPPIKEVAPKTA